MINESVSEGFDAYSLDIGRPNIRTRDDLEKWRNFHRWIFDSKCEVTVNKAFVTINERLIDGQSYEGNGHEYTFWFRTEKDKQRFHQVYEGTINGRDIPEPEPDVDTVAIPTELLQRVWKSLFKAPETATEELALQKTLDEVIELLDKNDALPELEDNND